MTYCFESIINMINFYDKEKENINNKQILLFIELRNRLRSFTGLENPDVILDGHRCSKSPVVICVYDKDKDPEYTTCIFCEKPYKRD